MSLASKPRDAWVACASGTFERPYTLESNLDLQFKPNTMQPFRRVLQATQRFTISGSIHFSGVALHEGGTSEITLEPNTDGIKWKFDGYGACAPDHIAAADHSTQLWFQNGINILCTEHLFCALYLAGLTDVVIKVHRGKELPLMDGSASAFLIAIEKKRKPLGNAMLPFIEATAPSVFTDEPDSLIAIEPALDFHAVGRIFYPTPIGNVSHEFSSVTGDKELARARTFIRDPIDRVPVVEVASNRLRGIYEATQGGSLVLWSSSSIEGKLRFPTELAAHKIVDFIGDLYVHGIRPRFSATLNRSGHRLNHLLAKCILEALEAA